jgi:hypothetical protein
MDAIAQALQPPFVTTERELMIRTTHSAGRAAADGPPILHAAIGLTEQIRAASDEIERLGVERSSEGSTRPLPARRPDNEPARHRDSANL